MRPKVGSGDGYLNGAGMTRAARRSDRLSAVFLIDCGDELPDKSRSEISRKVCGSKPGAGATGEDAVEVECAME